MLVGHVSMALVAKRLHPRLSLGTAVVAAILADVLLFLFVLADVEHVQFRDGGRPGEYFTGTDIALSHSLAMTLGWAAVLAAAYLWRSGERRASAFLAAVVVSHWILDLASHRPFLPVAPGAATYAGWALEAIGPAMAIEGAIWIGAVGLYVSDSRSANSAGRYVFWGGVAALTYVWYANVFGPTRGMSQQEAPIEGLLLLLMAIAWGYWMNRARVMKSA
jgi:hypothetical protein